MRNGALTVGELIERLQEFEDFIPVHLYRPVDEFDAFGDSPATSVERHLMGVWIS